MQINAPSLFQSKKFGAAALASVLSFFGIRYGMTVEQIAMVTGPLILFVGAQGLADIGKEKAKVEGPKALGDFKFPTSTPPTP